MPCQMVNPNEWLPRPCRQPFGQHHTRQHAANQTRSARHSDPVHLGQRKPRFGQCALHATIQSLGMRPRRDFRHDPAEIGMQGHLPLDDGRQDLTAPLSQPHYGCGAVIAARFDAKEGERCHIHCPQGFMRGNT